MRSGRLLVFGIGAITILAAGGCIEDVQRGMLGVPPETCSTGNPISLRGSATMEPGGDCIDCHTRNGGEAPDFQLAGTVMAAFDDDTNCAGVAGVIVKLTGADGTVVQLVSNSSGNFYRSLYASPLVYPFHAEVTYNGVTVQMLSARNAGETSCNRCHTAQGANGAPGRIVAPM